MKKGLFWILLFCLSLVAGAIEIQGKLVSHGVQLGDKHITFVDAENQLYQTKSNFLGEYRIEIPAGYYRILVEDPSYELHSAQDKVQRFVKNENWNIQVERKQQELEGMVVDEAGYPIEGAEITVKVARTTKKYESDAYGKFQVEVPEEMFTIFVHKEGFLLGGEVVYLNGKRAAKNVQIILKKKYSHIRGIVTDGVKALPGVTVRLRDQNLEILDQVYSDSLGYYSFSKVDSNRFVAVGVYEEGFQEYLSDFFFMDKNYEKKHIILEKI